MKLGLTKVAAVQMLATLADIPANISQAADLAEQAIKQGAKIIALPEFFTTSIVLDDRLFECSLPEENAAREMMQSLAKEYGVHIGGSYLEYDAGDVYNSYILVGPNGLVVKHRKDLPTMVENAYYIGGNDRGLSQAGDVSVGMAVCWETIRSASANRLRGVCDIVMSGSHWWSVPDWSFPRRYLEFHARLNADHMFRAPGRFARMVGAPLLHAAHTGTLKGDVALTSRWHAKMQTELVGETQIVNAQGEILARLEAADGAGFICAMVDVGRCAPPQDIPDAFWLENLPPFVRLMWTQQNHATKSIYKRAKAQGKIKPYQLTTSYSRNHH